jgi:adhesin transport system outer membrane protein
MDFRSGLVRGKARKLASTLLFFGGLSFGLSAWGMSEGEEGTLHDVLSRAVVDHPSILQRLSENEAAKNDRDAAKWQSYPSLSVSASEATTDINQANTVIQQPLWTGGRIAAAINEAEAGVKSSSFAVVQAEVAILTETIVRFFELNRARENLAIARANVKEHERLYDIIQRRVEAATSPDVDEMLASARLQFAESDAVAFEGAEDSARGVLSQLVGEPIQAIVAPEMPQPVMSNRDALLDMALDFAPSLSTLRADSERFEAQVDAAKALNRPQIALAYDRRFGDLLPGQEQEQLFLQVEYAPGAGLSARSSIAAARARQRGADLAVEAERRSITTQLDITWSELQAAYKQRVPAQRLVDATSQVVDSYLRQYTVGRKSWLDVLNAQREATQAKYTLVNTETSLMSAHYRLQVLLGQLNSRSLGVK